MAFQYQFPAIAEPEEMSKQLQHVKAEAQEAIEAYYEESAPWTLATELMDVIHAAETALSISGLTSAFTLTWRFLMLPSVHIIISKKLLRSIKSVSNLCAEEPAGRITEKEV